MVKVKFHRKQYEKIELLVHKILKCSMIEINRPHQMIMGDSIELIYNEIVPAMVIKWMQDAGFSLDGVEMFNLKICVKFKYPEFLLWWLK